MMRYPTAKIADFCRTGSGGTPSRSDMQRYYEGGTIPWVKSGELRESLIVKTEEHVTEAALKETSIKLVPSGAILLAMYGATVGRLAILGIEATTNQAVCHILPDSDVADIRYLYYALASQVPAIVAMGVGGAQPNISQGLIKDLKVPLPPLDKQRRIAAILDQADALRAKRREALAQLDSLTQSIFIEMFGDPVRNPKGWPVSPLNHCACRIQIGPFGSQLHEEDYIEGGIPLVNPTHIKNGKICADLSLTVSPEKHDELGQYHLSEGDLILGRRGEMGRCAVVTRNEHGWLCGTGSLFVRPTKSEISPIYLGFVIGSPSMRRYLENVAQGVTMANLNKDIVGALPIPIPPLNNQEKFVAQLSIVETSRNIQNKAIAELDALFASLQHRAFSGEL